MISHSNYKVMSESIRQIRDLLDRYRQNGADPELLATFNVLVNLSLATLDMAMGHETEISELKRDVARLQAEKLNP